MSHDVERWSPVRAWFYALLNRSPKSNVAVVEYADLTDRDHFLDVGCGPGAALEEALHRGARVAGVDPSASMVERASKRVPDADVRVGSAEAVPFDDDTFTVAVNVASFHHWADREAGLREMRRVLSPRGRLHIVEGQLKDGEEGHGLDLKDTRVLMERLSELGYTEPRTDVIETGRRHAYYVVTATNPG